MTGGPRASLSTSKPVTATAAGLSFWPHRMTWRSGAAPVRRTPRQGWTPVRGKTRRGFRFADSPTRRETPSDSSDHTKPPTRAARVGGKISFVVSKNHKAISASGAHLRLRLSASDRWHLLPVPGRRRRRRHQTSGLAKPCTTLGMACPKRVARFRTVVVLTARPAMTLPSGRNYTICHI